MKCAHCSSRCFASMISGPSRWRENGNLTWLWRPGWPRGSMRQSMKTLPITSPKISLKIIMIVSIAVSAWRKLSLFGQMIKNDKNCHWKADGNRQFENGFCKSLIRCSQAYYLWLFTKWSFLTSNFFSPLHWPQHCTTEYSDRKCKRQPPNTTRLLMVAGVWRGFEENLDF